MEKYIKQGWKVRETVDPENPDSRTIVDVEGRLVAKVPVSFGPLSKRKDGDSIEIAHIMAASAKLYEALNLCYNRLGRLGELTPDAFGKFVEEALQEAEGK